MKKETEEKKNCCCGNDHDEHCCENEHEHEHDCCCDDDCDCNDENCCCEDDCCCEDGDCDCDDECCCGGEVDVTIKILGGGCAKCNKLTMNSIKAVQKLKLKAKIVKVTDMKEIMAFGVMSTPALVIDEKVVSSGQVLNARQIMKLLK